MNRYVGLDFHEDPFKDANHRYGDPFDIEGADPFVEDNFDPFTANIQDAFYGPTKRGGGQSDSNIASKDSSSIKEKTEKSSYLSPFRPKKEHSFSGVDKLKSAVGLSHMGINAVPSAPPQQVINDQLEALHVRMASEASKRAEEDRIRRIQLREEQDLAYAIALSRAEALSHKQQ